ncbi:hypothetical protein FGO68_gene13639 [Halteria grandinella]|uniref:Uncharacterized protein n=1 Tax=Halteria grandinella TaxID=5974 RepID=A0A8J8NZR1_HALGN|nr:hypothetical protein FGO68_gene13639 [Halteria grandinella]
MVQMIMFGNNTYQIRINGDQGVSGSLLEDWDFTGQPYIEVENEKRPKGELVKVSSNYLKTRYDMYDSKGAKLNASSILEYQDSDYNQILYDTVYLQSVKSSYTTEKNRNFTLSTHEKAHLLSDLQSISITIEGASFYLTHLLVSDQAKHVQRTLSQIYKEHIKPLQTSPN